MNIQRITFQVDGTPVVGHLYSPDKVQSQNPAILLAGPMTSVKEQVTGTYARQLCEAGYIALSIDHRHYGESGGVPRQYEYYRHKIEDLQAAFDWLKNNERVDATRVSVVGICLGAGYLAHAISDRSDVYAFSAVAGYYRDVDEMRERDTSGFDAKVQQGRAARLHYEKTGDVETVPAVALNGDAAMLLESTYSYYAVRAKHPNYRNAFAVMSREYFLPFDVQSAAPLVTAPFLMIHGDNALNPLWAERFFDRISSVKQRCAIEAENQTAYYDQPDVVAAAVKSVASFIDSLN